MEEAIAQFKSDFSYLCDKHSNFSEYQENPQNFSRTPVQPDPLSAAKEHIKLITLVTRLTEPDLSDFSEEELYTVLKIVSVVIGR